MGDGSFLTAEEKYLFDGQKLISDCLPNIHQKFILKILFISLRQLVIRWWWARFMVEILSYCDVVEKEYSSEGKGKSFARNFYFRSVIQVAKLFLGLHTQTFSIFRSFGLQNNKEHFLSLEMLKKEFERMKSKFFIFSTKR